MKKILKFLCFMIVIYFLSVGIGEALLRYGICNGMDAIVQYESSGFYENNQYPWMRRNETEKSVFCLKKRAAAPTYGLDQNFNCYTCPSTATINYNSNTNNKLRAGIGYLIEQYDGTKNSYLRIQSLIHYFLYNYNGGDPVSNGYRLSRDNLYVNAVNKYNSYDSSINLSSSKLSLSYSNGYYTGSMTYSGTSYASHKLTINGVEKNSYATINGKTISISIPVGEFTQIDNDVKLTIYGPTTTYNLADFRGCGDDRQDIAEEATKSETKTPSDSATANIKPVGHIQINKENSKNEPVEGFGGEQTTIFTLYNDECSTEIGTMETNSSGIAYYKNLLPGTYYIKETRAKTGYIESSECRKIEVKPGAPTEKQNTITIKNLTECEVKFDEYKSTIAKRIELYNYLKNKYPSINYRGLLDTRNTTGATACSKVELSHEYEYGCFSATTHIKDKKTSNSLSISNSNLSMYDNNYYGIYDASKNGIKVFCSTSFNLENSIGSNFGTKKSGRPIIQVENSVAKGKLTRTCYAYVENNNLDIQNAIKNKLNVNEENAQGFYNNHINSVEIPDYTTNLDKRYKLPYEIQNAVTNVENEGILTKIVTIVETNYLLPYMHAYNKDGRIIYSDSPTYGSNYKLIGKGLISRLNAGPGDYNFYIFVSLNNDIFGSGKESENDKLCSYTIENELIDNRNNINLEFRSVKTGIDNSFFSKTGSGTRKIGANWVGNENILKDNNDSYNKNNATEAKYSIILTPAIIEKIRDYNKTNKYDDYNFDCKDNGTICISNYLSKLKNEYGLEINTTNRTDYENIG